MTLKEVESNITIGDVEYRLCDDWINEEPTTSYLVVIECFHKSLTIKLEFGYVLHRLTTAQVHRLAALQLWLQLYATDEEVKNEYSFLQPLIDEMEIKVTPMTGLGKYTEPDPNDPFESILDNDQSMDLSEYKHPKFSQNVRRLTRYFNAIHNLKKIIKTSENRLIKIDDIWYPEEVVLASHLPLLNNLNQRIQDHKKEMELDYSNERIG